MSGGALRIFPLVHGNGFVAPCSSSGSSTNEFSCSTNGGSIVTDLFSLWLVVGALSYAVSSTVIPVYLNMFR